MDRREFLNITAATVVGNHDIFHGRSLAQQITSTEPAKIRVAIIYSAKIKSRRILTEDFAQGGGGWI